LSSWLEEINKAGSVASAVPALLAIEAIGTIALPFLCENVRLANPSRLDERIIAFTQRFDFLASRFSPRSSLYGPTCLAFRVLGTNAAPIVAELGELLLQPEHSASAKLALYAIGPSATPAFERGCASPDATVRTESALYLAKIQFAKKNLWTSWGGNRYGRPQFTLSTATTLEELETLTALLKHPDPAVRHASAEALQKDETKFFLAQFKRSRPIATIDPGRKTTPDHTNTVDLSDPFPLLPIP
jgi:hypothetical protein